MHRDGVAFYGLRHSFRTAADECGDQPACDFAMGHSDSSMADSYRHSISEKRLQNVVEHVRAWLFGNSETTETEETVDGGPVTLRMFAG